MAQVNALAVQINVTENLIKSLKAQIEKAPFNGDLKKQLQDAMEQLEKFTAQFNVLNQQVEQLKEPLLLIYYNLALMKKLQLLFLLQSMLKVRIY